MPEINKVDFNIALNRHGLFSSLPIDFINCQRHPAAALRPGPLPEERLGTKFPFLKLNAAYKISIHFNRLSFFQKTKSAPYPNGRILTGFSQTWDMTKIFDCQSNIEKPNSIAVRRCTAFDPKGQIRALRVCETRLG